MSRQLRLSVGTASKPNRACRKADRAPLTAIFSLLFSSALFGCSEPGDTTSPSATGTEPTPGTTDSAASNSGQGPDAPSAPQSGSPAPNQTEVPGSPGSTATPSMTGPSPADPTTSMGGVGTNGGAATTSQGEAGGVSTPSVGGSGGLGETPGAAGNSNIGGAGGDDSMQPMGNAGAPDLGTSDGTDGDYYVAVDGDDGNPGTIDEPFATMQKAIDTAEPGELVYVRGGVYEIVNGARADAGVLFHRSGTSEDNRIRYFAFPGEVPVFEFENLNLQPDPNYTTGVVVSGAWLHLKGFEIRNVPMNTRSNTGMSVNGGAHDDIFELLNIHHNFGSGMFIHTTTGGHRVINSDSHDNYDPFSHQGDGENADGFGVHYQKEGSPTMFSGCRAWWNSDDGWDFISQEVPVIVENSWAYGHGYINSGTGTAGNGNGFKIGSSKTGIRHVVSNSVAWGNRASGFYANHSSGGNDWFNNTSYDNGTQFNMLASTWDADGNRTDGVILMGALAHVMRNNIGYPNDNTNMQGVDSQFNSWDLGLSPSDGDFLSVSDEDMLGPRQADGSLPDVDFLRLREGSQMVDRGTDVGLPFNGGAPDLGADEF